MSAVCGLGGRWEHHQLCMWAEGKVGTSSAMSAVCGLGGKVGTSSVMSAVCGLGGRWGHHQLCLLSVD